eukprot:TRINITY_DN3683_c0_g3_i2.p1 TRINITY_DN3683_c0_g3~~TRINITY_DN3683_c0_g3_i2.p1  ORF type:complete len:323 (+),score=-6.80 TRINITY_DN3683_c0_g3_i2:309-1277(+)
MIVSVSKDTKTQSILLQVQGKDNCNLTGLIDLSWTRAPDKNYKQYVFMAIEPIMQRMSINPDSSKKFCIFSSCFLFFWSAYFTYLYFYWASFLAIPFLIFTLYVCRFVYAVCHSWYTRFAPLLIVVACLGICTCLLLLPTNAVFLSLSSTIFLPQLLHTAISNQRPLPEYYHYILMMLFINFPQFCSLICPVNLFNFEPTIPITSVFFMIQFVNVILLCLQKRMHPRFFLPQGVRRYQTYVYHPKQICLTDEEGKVITCSICLVDLIDPSSKQLKEGQNISNVSKAIMKTPCSHIFHTSCLRPWMIRKLECPTCRAPLPDDS